MTTGPQGRIYDEFAKLMNDAAGLAQSAGREVSSAFRAQGESCVTLGWLQDGSGRDAREHGKRAWVDTRGKLDLTWRDQ